MHKAKLSVLRLFLILFLLKELQESIVVLPHHHSAGAPVRSVTRCAEPTTLGFIPWYFLVCYGNKTIIRWFTLVCRGRFGSPN